MHACVKGPSLSWRSLHSHNPSIVIACPFIPLMHTSKSHACREFFYHAAEVKCFLPSFEGRQTLEKNTSTRATIVRDSPLLLPMQPAMKGRELRERSGDRPKERGKRTERGQMGERTEGTNGTSVELI
mmetsp:Transcript_34056/g.67409  ORF Transcript_34056/g.67409 Transcript_34056/m.67409 type:complete len:128 (+) Transcript_34056:464-847(+)